MVFFLLFFFCFLFVRLQRQRRHLEEFTKSEFTGPAAGNSLALNFKNLQTEPQCLIWEMFGPKAEQAWKTKPVVVLNNDETNQTLIERLEKSFQIHCKSSPALTAVNWILKYIYSTNAAISHTADSNHIPPFSCYFPSSSASMLLVDFASVTPQMHLKEIDGQAAYEETVSKYVKNKLLSNHMHK